MNKTDGNTTILGPPEWYSSDSAARANGWANAMVGLISNAFLLYLIFWRTPVSVKLYSRVMLICVVADLFYLAMDVLCQIRMLIVDGVLLFAVSGPASHLSYEGQSRMVSGYFMAIVLSVTILPVQYFCRYRIAVTNRFSWLNKAKLISVAAFFGICHGIFGAHVYRNSFKVRPNFDYHRLWYAGESARPLVIGDLADTSMRFYILCASLYYTVSYSLVILFIILTLRRLHRRQQGGPSSRTRCLQTQFSRALTVQAVVPIFICGVPSVAAIIMVLFHWNSPLISTSIAFALSWVPALNPLTTIFFIIPYRRTVGRLFVGMVKWKRPNSHSDTHQFSRPENSAELMRNSLQLRVAADGSSTVL